MKQRLKDLFIKVIVLAVVKRNHIAIALAIIATVAAIIVTAARAPDMHVAYQRSSVGNSVVYVYIDRPDLHYGGGTGSAIVAPSGNTYIITNAHVCDASIDKVHVYVGNGEHRPIPRRILEISDETDLCVVENLPGLEGLKVANNAPTIGDILTSVGHPVLLPITISSGQYIGPQDTYIELGGISYLNPDTGEWEQIPENRGGISTKHCTGKKYEIEVVDYMTPFGNLKMKMCFVVTKRAYITNMVIQSGSSGSPVVNWYGNVVGFVFAGDKMGWAIIVSYDDVISFLKTY